MVQGTFFQKGFLAAGGNQALSIILGFSLFFQGN